MEWNFSPTLRLQLRIKGREAGTVLKAVYPGESVLLDNVWLEAMKMGRYVCFSICSTFTLPLVYKHFWGAAGGPGEVLMGPNG